MPGLLHIIIPFIIAFYIGSVMIPKIVLISKKKKIYDHIDRRKSHVKPTSRLGGMLFFPALFIAVTATILLHEVVLDTNTIRGNDIFIRFNAFLFGVTALYVIGIADDFIGISYKYKFLFQVLVSIFIITSGLKVTSLDGIFGIYELPSSVATIFTFIGLVGLINSYNLLDGIDGLCSGVAVVTMALLTAWFHFEGMYVDTIIASAFMGTCAVFLRYNITNGRYKLFMGDTGSLIIGFTISFLLLAFITNQQSAAIESRYFASPLVIAFSILFVPCIDTLRVFGRRMLKRHNPFNPDKTHLHHLVIATGVSHKIATLLIVISALLNIVITVILSPLMGATSLFISLLIYGAAITYLLPIRVGRLLKK